jgi:hypothetical protein
VSTGHIANSHRTQARIFDSCLEVPDEVLSTRCGGQGVVIFYGMAKPVRAPQIGLARGYQ